MRPISNSSFSISSRHESVSWHGWMRGSVALSGAEFWVLGWWTDFIVSFSFHRLAFSVLWPHGHSHSDQAWRVVMASGGVVGVGRENVNLNRTGTGNQNRSGNGN